MKAGISLTTSLARILHEELLIEGSSQFDLRRIEKKNLEFAAHTFDWWIPVKPIPGIGDTAHEKIHFPTVSGQSRIRFPLGIPTEIMRAGLITQKETLDPATVTLGIGWEDGAQTWEGHHREMAETNIQVHVKLDWQGDHLRIAIENRPEDRNYVLFLVVEETFGSIDADEDSPKVLHTSFPIAINGQLTFVPQSLFDEEKAAGKKLQEFLSHYAVSAKPKHGDPVFERARLGELATHAGVERFIAALNQFEPDKLKQLVHRFEGHK